MAALRRLWSHRERRPAFVAAALLTLAAVLVYPLVDWRLQAAGVAPTFFYWDFGAYGAAVVRWLAGEPLYVPNQHGGYHGKFLYPPIVLLLFRPFLLLPTGVAAEAWVLFSLLLLWVSFQAAVAACGLDLRGGERLVALWALFGYQPLMLSLKMGQTAAFLGGVLCLALAALVAGERGSTPASLASGALTAVAGVVKLPYAPAGAHLLRDRVRMAGALATGVGVLAVSLAVFGVEAHRAYLDVLRWGIEEGGRARSPVLWLPPYYRPFYGLNRPFYGVSAATVLRGLAAIAISIGVALAGRGAARESFALGVAAIPLIAPQTYTYYLVALVPAVVALLAAELDRGAAGRPVVPVVGLLLAHLHAYGLKLLTTLVPQGFPPSPAFAPLLAALQPGLWGNLLVVGLAGARVAGAIAAPERLPAWPESQ